MEGLHNNCVAKNPRLVTSKDKGTPGIEIDFVNADGEGITGTVWLADATFERAVKSLRAMGWEGDDLSELSSVGSKLCQLVIESEEYKGKLYLKVAWINENESTGGGGLQPRMDPAQAKAFAARMRGSVIAAGGGKASPWPAPGAGGAPRAPAPRPAAPAQTPAPAGGFPNDIDDDIGF